MLPRIFRQTAVPPEFRGNFQHLYFDIAWFGVLSGSAVNFLNIYATRIGATGFQIGLISAMSAFVNLLLAIPAGRWLEQRNTSRAIFWTALTYRAGYLPFIFIPLVGNKTFQITGFILLIFLMAIPLTPLGVGFNALFAEAVPNEYRAHVAGIRNVMFALAYMVTSVVSGVILERTSFPHNYQIVFALGALGAGMSTYHIYFVKPVGSVPDAVQPKPEVDPPSNRRHEPRGLISALRLDIWKTHFRNVLLALFAFHFGQYIAIPIFPIYNVRVLNLTDENLGIGTACFYLSVLISSTQLRRLAHRVGNKKLTGSSVALMSVYPFLLAISSRVWHFYGLSLISGLNFAMMSGSYANYMLENIPANDRPSHLAWYNVVLNAAILLGSLTGPAFADQLGLAQALLLIAGLRVLSGLVLLRWG